MDHTSHAIVNKSQAMDHNTLDEARRLLLWVSGVPFEVLPRGVYRAKEGGVPLPAAAKRAATRGGGGGSAGAGARLAAAHVQRGEFMSKVVNSCPQR